jgi:hypothetical protein
VPGHAGGTVGVQIVILLSKILCSLTIITLVAGKQKGSSLSFRAQREFLPNDLTDRILKTKDNKKGLPYLAGLFAFSHSATAKGYLSAVITFRMACLLM